MEATHILLPDLGGPECEIVESASTDLVTIEVQGYEGYGTVPVTWVKPIPGKEKPTYAAHPVVGWVGRDREGDIWHHFKQGWFLMPGDTQQKTWAELHQFGPFETIFDPAA